MGLNRITKSEYNVLWHDEKVKTAITLGKAESNCKPMFYKI